MPRWRCSRCGKRMKAGAKKEKASQPKFWPLYQKVEGRFACETDTLCPRCHLRVQKESGNLLKRKGYKGPLPSWIQENVNEPTLEVEIATDFESVPEIREDQLNLSYGVFHLHDPDSIIGDSLDATNSEAENLIEDYTEVHWPNDMNRDVPPHLLGHGAYMMGDNSPQGSTIWPDHEACVEPDQEPEFGSNFQESQLENWTRSQTTNRSFSEHKYVSSDSQFSLVSLLEYNNSENPNDGLNREGSNESSKPQFVQLPFIETCKSTQRCCFICGSVVGRTRIPQIAIQDVWKKVKVLIPAKNRTCASHLKDSKFTEEVLERIRPLHSRCSLSTEGASEWIHLLTNQLTSKVATDFSVHSDLTSEDYAVLLGINRVNFDLLMTYTAGIKNSCNRNKRNAVAMLLMKLRRNLSLEFMAFLFGVQSKQIVSDTIDSVVSALKQNFVPKYLGYSHTTREEVIHQHSVPAFNLLLGHEGSLMLILDGTYVYFQRPSDHELQRIMYSPHKLRHLLKFMMVVTTTGHIIECEGPYGADYNNNDAKILRNMLGKEGESILGFYDVGDVAILDRGFRDIVDELEDRQVWSFMPKLLPKDRQKFSTEEANESRQVTMMRWIVEAVNGRVKNKFHFFDQTVQNTYIPKASSLFRIACSLINAFSPPIFSASDDHTELIKIALKRLKTTNDLEKEIEEKQLARKRVVWKKAAASDVPDFPKLSMATLKEITLGIYQLNLASKYTKEHMTEDGAYDFFVHQEDSTLICAKLASRFIRSKQHKVWLRFVPNGVTSEDIRWVCSCKTGSRTMGCCAHVASVIWYLGYSRYHPTKVPKSRPYSFFVLDAASEHAMQVEDED